MWSPCGFSSHGHPKWQAYFFITQRLIRWHLSCTSSLLLLTAYQTLILSFSIELIRSHFIKFQSHSQLILQNTPRFNLEKSCLLMAINLLSFPYFILLMFLNIFLYIQQLFLDQLSTMFQQVPTKLSPEKL